MFINKQLFVNKYLLTWFDNNKQQIFFSFAYWLLLREYKNSAAVDDILKIILNIRYILIIQTRAFWLY